MNCVILQPSYIPWRGYFDQIRKADVFVFYDDVPYDRGGWRNRNRISTSNGPAWLTIPIHAQGFHSGVRILDVAIAWDVKRRWNLDHIQTLRHSYARAPYYSTYAPLLEEQLQYRDELLVDFLIRTTKALADALGIKDTVFLRSSELDIAGERTERLVRIAQSVGADRYISGPSAADYIDVSQFQKADITLEYMRYDYPEYKQLREPFDGNLSVVDLLMMTGPEAPNFIRSR